MLVLFCTFLLSIKDKNILCISITDAKCPFIQKIIVIIRRILPTVRRENNHTLKIIIES